MKKLSIVLALAASPAMASSGLEFSLQNTNFVVLVAFIAFVGLLVYVGVPRKLTGMLDARAAAREPFFRLPRRRFARRAPRLDVTTPPRGSGLPPARATRGLATAACTGKEDPLA